MPVVLVGWRTEGRLYETFSELEVPDGLQWYPGNEVDSEEDLTLTLKVLGDDPMLVLTRPVESDIRALGAWLAAHAGFLDRVETAVIGDDWSEIARSVEAVLDWPKWPLAWLPLRSDASETQDRLPHLAKRAAAGERTPIAGPTSPAGAAHATEFAYSVTAVHPVGIPQVAEGPHAAEAARPAGVAHAAQPARAPQAAHLLEAARTADEARATGAGAVEAGRA